MLRQDDVPAGYHSKGNRWPKSLTKKQIRSRSAYANCGCGWATAKWRSQKCSTSRHIYDGDTDHLGDKLKFLLAGITDRSLLEGLPLGEHFGKLLSPNDNNDKENSDYATTRKRKRG